MASRNVAEDASHRRNYAKLKQEVWAIDREFLHGGFSKDVFRMIRARFGCRATEISDAYIDDALAFVKDLATLISRAKYTAQDDLKAQAREASAARLDSIWAELSKPLRRRETPALRLVPDCGRDLGSAKSNDIR